MACGCVVLNWECVDNDALTLSWEEVCASVADLVPFNASDGVFLTSEGYTILVKI